MMYTLHLSTLYFSPGLCIIYGEAVPFPRTGVSVYRYFITHLALIIEGVPELCPHVIRPLL